MSVSNKKKNRTNKKGYIQIDFAFAALIFFFFAFLIYDFYSDAYNAKVDVYSENSVHYLSADLCKFLTKSKGSPENWHEDFTNSNFIGLVQNDNNLSIEKVNFLKTQNYFRIYDSLGMNRYFYLKIDDFNNPSTNYLEIGNTSGYDSIGQKSVCYSNLNDTPVTISVEVWR
jgi:hypothetical protein